MKKLFIISLITTLLTLPLWGGIVGALLVYISFGSLAELGWIISILPESAIIPAQVVLERVAPVLVAISITALLSLSLFGIALIARGWMAPIQVKEARQKRMAPGAVASPILSPTVLRCALAVEIAVCAVIGAIWILGQ